MLESHQFVMEYPKGDHLCPIVLTEFTEVTG